MAEYIITYRASDGVSTERRISDLELEDSKRVHAFCHLRHERRTFVFSRIERAIDAQTGEVVNLASLLGIDLPPPPGPPPVMRTPAELEVLRRGSEEYKRQRNAEKRSLMKPFGLEFVYEHFKDQLFGLFGHRCAKCRRSLPLELDHHIPMVLGGRLVPGNIGALCTRCNNAKGDRAPLEFYSDLELQWVEDALRRQPALFSFKFDWNRWHTDRKGYLLAIGIDATLVDEMFTNPDHKWHIRPPEILMRLSVEIVEEKSTDGSTDLKLSLRKE